MPTETLDTAELTAEASQQPSLEEAPEVSVIAPSLNAALDSLSDLGQPLDSIGVSITLDQSKMRLVNKGAYLRQEVISTPHGHANLTQADGSNYQAPIRQIKAIIDLLSPAKRAELEAKRDSLRTKIVDLTNERNASRLTDSRRATLDKQIKRLRYAANLTDRQLAHNRGESASASDAYFANRATPEALGTYDAALTAALQRERDREAGRKGQSAERAQASADAAVRRVVALAEGVTVESLADVGKAEINRRYAAILEAQERASASAHTATRTAGLPPATPTPPPTGRGLKPANGKAGKPRVDRDALGLPTLVPAS